MSDQDNATYVRFIHACLGYSGEGEEDAEDTLFKLVRNESEKDKKKRRVNFIVILAGGEENYVPTRWPSLMMADKEDEEKFIPQCPGRCGEKKASTSEKRERSVSSEDPEVDKGKSPPAEEAIAVTITYRGRSQNHDRNASTLKSRRLRNRK